MMPPSGTVTPPVGHAAWTAGVAVVREAAHHPVEESDEPTNLPERQRRAVRRDRSTVEGGAPSAGGAGTPECERKRPALCPHRSSTVDAV